jgi:hypothetical protein
MKVKIIRGNEFHHLPPGRKQTNKQNDDDGADNNSVQFLFIYVQYSQPKGRLQSEHE